ncbi:MAG: formylglycine-generating enzyme family protein, partial [Planctomycetota bacterium]
LRKRQHERLLHIAFKRATPQLPVYLEVRELEAVFRAVGDRSEFIFSTSAFDGRLTPPHGRRKPNPWGLYDMHGMVYEWVLDWYGPYGTGPRTDPLGPATGTERVMRGGCYVSAREKIGEREATEAEMVRSIRSASRNHLPPDFELPITGMRVALAPEAREGKAKE